MWGGGAEQSACWEEFLHHGSPLTSLMALGDLGKLRPPVRPWYLFSSADSRSFSWGGNTGSAFKYFEPVFSQTSPPLP